MFSSRCNKPDEMRSYGGLQMASDKGIDASDVNNGLSIAELLTKTLALWIRNLKAYVIIVGIILALFTILQASIAFFLYASYNISIFADDIGAFLTMIINAILFPEIVEENYVLNLGISLGLVLVGLLITALVTGGAIKFALDDISTGKPDLAASVSIGLNKLLPMFLLQAIIASILAVFLSPGQSMMAFGLATDNFEMLVNGLSIFLVLGVIALVLLVQILVSPVVLIARDKSPLESLNISFALTRGKLLHIAFGWILVLVVIFFIDFVISTMVSVIAFPLGTEILVLIVSIMNGLFLAPIMPIFYAVVFVDLITRPEITQREWW